MKQMTGTVSQSCSTLWNSMDCTPPGSSVCRILQARILEWIEIPFCRGSSQPRDWTCVSCIADRFFISEQPGNQEIYIKRRKIQPIFQCIRTDNLSVCFSCSVVSNTLWPHGLYSTRLLCPWGSPGQNTGVGCRALLQIFLMHVSCTVGRFSTIWATREALPGHGSNLNVHQWRNR